ncbi:hypothetical protein HMI54_014558 [Coelomomyces lativittatus]|nr:hypothetical protein HMI56_006532 [Coelomomyces lativittatus]KAJ1514010.1 hypothetical protein HMI54_014558 [Coelomomyces lativittatus]KAJ1517862.1 hypothetical protein HMI55_005386 [Coelomomyces lativittatus]
MVQLLLASTPSIQLVLQRIYETEFIQTETTEGVHLKHQVVPYLSSDAKIPYDLLKACYLVLKPTQPSLPSFRTLLKGSCIVFEEKPILPKSAELQTLLAEAKKIVDARSYFEMTKKTFESHAPVPSSTNTPPMTDAQFLACAANVFLTVVSVVVAILWIASEYEIGMHVLLALFGGMIVLCAEVFLAYRNA